MSLLRPAAPDFSDPLGLLAACHERMLANCALLQRMLEWLPAHGVDAEIRRSALQVMRYFETAARHHHADEELDLFPVLAQSPGLVPLIERLQSEHGLLEAAWEELAAQLQALLDGRDAPALESKVDAFVTAYGAHIETENAGVLPVARELLSAAQIATLGHAMARRRGVTSVATDRPGAPTHHGSA